MLFRKVYGFLIMSAIFGEICYFFISNYIVDVVVHYKIFIYKVFYFNLNIRI